MKKMLFAICVLLAAVGYAYGEPWTSGGSQQAKWDARYLNESSNLSDLDSSSIGLTNLGFSAFVKTLIGAADAATFYTGIVQAGSETDSGALKLTTDADANDATVSDKALDPESAYDSSLGTKWVILTAVAAETVNTTGEKDEAYFCFVEPGTYYLVATEAHSLTAATTGVLTVQLIIVQADGDQYTVCSTPITIDATETDSSTATTASALGTHYTMAEGDIIFPDVTVAGDGYGCQVRLGFRKQ